MTEVVLSDRWPQYSHFFGKCNSLLLRLLEPRDEVHNFRLGRERLAGDGASAFESIGCSRRYLTGLVGNCRAQGGIAPSVAIAATYGAQERLASGCGYPGGSRSVSLVQELRFD